MRNIKLTIEYDGKDFDKASTLLDKEKINELLKIDLPNEEFSKSLNV